MRIKHTLYKVSNGWLLVPENFSGLVDNTDFEQCLIFKDLNEFAKYTPKRVRNRKPKTKPQPQPA